jgi:6-phosphogluconolactonase
LTPEVRVFPTAEAVATASAGDFCRAVRASVGPFRVALAGGSTPRATYDRLSRELLPWDRIFFYWGDERCVPVGHADRNDRMADEALLSRVALPAGNIHRIPAELPDSEDAARRYEALLNFKFDYVFLGLGADGHTASLFPGTPAVTEATRRAVPVWVEAQKSRRITLTLPVLNEAQNISFLAVGAEKAPMLARVCGLRPTPALPASLVRPASGRLVWFVDAAATVGIDRRPPGT